MLVVSSELCQHVFRSDIFFVVVFQTLVPRDIADGTQRGPADLPRPLRDFVRHAEDLLAVLIQQQVVIAKVLPAHVPVEILRFHIKREHVREQWTQRSGDLGDTFGA